MITTSQKPGRLAFTLVELLVVLTVMTILAGLAIPMMGVMMSSNPVLAGIDTIGVAVAANKPFALREVVDLGDIDSDYAGATYSGTAIIFTPAGEIRLVENDQSAEDEDEDKVEKLDPPYNGYRDIPGREYIQLPRTAGVFGITRTSQHGLVFLPPPFAVRFDEEGQLIAGGGVSGTPGPRIVVYDGNYDGAYSINVHRKDPFHPNKGYEPDRWDPSTKRYKKVHADDLNEKKPGIHPDTKRHKLPFEAMAAVIGVVVYDKDLFREQFDPDSGDPGVGPRPAMIAENNGEVGFNLNGGMGKWLLKNGEALFFNRYTGTILEKGVQG